MMHYAKIEAAIRQGTAADWVPRWALELLRDIASGRCDLTAVLHPLGFLCIPAQRSGEHGICVHVWTPALQPTITTSQVHSHSWDLTSYVLYGTLHNQRIRVAEAGAAATHRIFEVRSQGDRDELQATTRLVSCEPEPTREYGAGSVYYLEAGEFHTTVVLGAQEVATVVLGRSRPPAADLSAGPLHARSHTVTRSRCTAPETARAALLVAGRLEALGIA
jgi:hypothetical protein